MVPFNLDVTPYFHSISFLSFQAFQIFSITLTTNFNVKSKREMNREWKWLIQMLFCRGLTSHLFAHLQWPSPFLFTECKRLSPGLQSLSECQLWHPTSTARTHAHTHTHRSLRAMFPKGSLLLSYLVPLAFSSASPR